MVTVHLCFLWCPQVSCPWRRRRTLSWLASTSSQTRGNRSPYRRPLTRSWPGSTRTCSCSGCRKGGRRGGGGSPGRWRSRRWRWFSSSRRSTARSRFCSCTARCSGRPGASTTRSACPAGSCPTCPAARTSSRWLPGPRCGPFGRCTTARKLCASPSIVAMTTTPTSSSSMSWSSGAAPARGRRTSASSPSSPIWMWTSSSPWKDCPVTRPPSPPTPRCWSSGSRTSVSSCLSCPTPAAPSVRGAGRRRTSTGTRSFCRYLAGTGGGGRSLCLLLLGGGERTEK